MNAALYELRWLLMGMGLCMAMILWMATRAE